MSQDYAPQKESFSFEEVPNVINSAASVFIQLPIKNHLELFSRIRKAKRTVAQRHFMKF